MDNAHVVGVGVFKVEADDSGSDSVEQETAVGVVWATSTSRVYMPSLDVVNRKPRPGCPCWDNLWEALGYGMCKGFLMGNGFLWFAEFVLGVIYRDSCEDDKMVPISLLVHGSFGTLLWLSIIFPRCYKKMTVNMYENNDDDDEKTPFCLKIYQIIMWFVTTAALIFASINVFGGNLTIENFNKAACSNALFFCSFIFTGLNIIFGGISCIIFVTTYLAL